MTEISISRLILKLQYKIMKGNYLITTDNWFVAPDGKQYQAVYGNCEVLDDGILGVKTNERSTNWFVKVGSEDNHIIVAGCQIHYAVKCDKPYDGSVENWNLHKGKYVKYTSPCRIYFADEPDKH